MARTPKPQRDSSDGDPRPRKSRTSTRPKTDLSIFLQYPLGSMNDDAFRAVCDQIRTLLAPRTDLEHRGIDIILWTFERVRKAYAALDQGVPGANQYLKTMLTSFRERQKTFDLLRKIIDSDPENPTLASILLPEAPPNPPVPVASAPPQSTKPEPEPVLPSEDPIDDGKDDEVDEIEAAARDWRSRVAMVPSFDARWPVLDQFNLRVDDILSMRDHGVPEDEILDRHPGLTYTDLACCYSCEADGYRGPLEPPYPDDITLVEDDPEAD
ncbi:DUF433 domain-containing protein [Tautonia marina]|uniref:DUF433 domain-containing protein n=1 Tax=Tautonia marina TaxID=2653855 RepID=UPI001375F7CB|nr:DUF433 domain-containing protein [Tautonia marina]